MKKLLVSIAMLLVVGAFVGYFASCGFFCPGNIWGNTHYPDMALRAEKALKYAERKGGVNQKRTATGGA